MFMINQDEVGKHSRGSIKSRIEEKLLSSKAWKKQERRNAFKDVNHAA
jgi:hypothetical protein